MLEEATDSGNIVQTASSLTRLHYDVLTAIYQTGLQDNIKQLNELYKSYVSQIENTSEDLREELCEEYEDSIRDILQIAEEDLNDVQERIEKS